MGGRALVYGVDAAEIEVKWMDVLIVRGVSPFQATSSIFVSVTLSDRSFVYFIVDGRISRIQQNLKNVLQICRSPEYDTTPPLK